MFIVLLKFSENKGQAKDHMPGHNAWIQQGFDENIFLLAGSLHPKAGGTIIAHNTTLTDLQTRINEDPFVQENIVNAEILEISPSKTHERLQFLID